VDQALFAARVRIHTTATTSPYYLAYGVHPRIPTDEGIELTTNESLRDFEIRIAKVQTARAKSHHNLLKRAIYTHGLRDDKVTAPRNIEDGIFVLVSNEQKQKFEGNFFDLYQVIRSHPLNTYVLRTPHNRVLERTPHQRRKASESPLHLF
jgi:hypothetical protein